VITIHSLLKPRKGDACNGCGACCIAEPCALAREILGATKGRCPALETDAERSYCGIVRRPAHYMFGEDAPASESGQVSALFASALGLGAGCDADDDGWEELA